MRSVVGLASWVQPGDGRRLDGRQVLLVHGTADRIAPLARTETVARELEARNEVRLLRLDGAGHALMRQAPRVDVLAARFARSTLLDDA